MLKKAFSVILLCLATSSLSFSQDMLSGKVTTFDSIPLINAKIIVKGSKQEFYTDSIGNFLIRCILPVKLKASADGFISETVKVEEADADVMINLDLKSNDNVMETVASSGHVGNFGSFQTMAETKVENDYSNYRNVYEIIRTSSSGVTIQGNDIIIRGKQSFGSDAALVILDGVEVPSSSISTLSPEVVKSVNVLKGSAAAIYGVRGANGVVEIETKRGGD